MMIPLCIASVNKAKIRYDDADHFFYLVVPFARAELINEHFCLAKADALEKSVCWGHLHLYVDLFAGLGLDADVKDGEFAFEKRKKNAKMSGRAH
jgi:hypothetical protein